MHFIQNTKAQKIYSQQSHLCGVMSSVAKISSMISTDL